MSSFNEAYQWATAYCSRVERCPSEVLRGLERFELDTRESARLMARLSQEGFLDEARYARAYVNDQIRFAHWGRAKVRYSLKTKGVSEDKIQEALETFPEEEYREIVRSALDEKQRTGRFRDARDRWAKLMRFAAGRGYEWSLAKELCGEPDDC